MAILIVKCNVTPVKSLAMQADAVDLSMRNLLVRQRTQLVNSVRGHAAEFGIITAKGIARIQLLLEKIAETDIPDAAEIALAQLGQCDDELHAQLDARLAARHKAHLVSQRLATVPGVGPTTALTLATKVDVSQFKSARQFAA